MKALGFVAVVFAGLTIYWVVTSHSYFDNFPAAPLPSAGSAPASTTPIPGTQGGTAATGPAPGTTLFNQLFPQQASVHQGA